MATSPACGRHKSSYQKIRNIGSLIREYSISVSNGDRAFILSDPGGCVMWKGPRSRTQNVRFVRETEPSWTRARSSSKGRPSLRTPTVSKRCVALPLVRCCCCGDVSSPYTHFTPLQFSPPHPNPRSFTTPTSSGTVTVNHDG